MLENTKKSTKKHYKRIAEQKAKPKKKVRTANSSHDYATPNKHEAA